uniref:NR LBD domain-containing protein n=1 Tax=Macrostomum lignano TaxID=282301 RepID=A0A1I8FQK5_9PLAT
LRSRAATRSCLWARLPCSTRCLAIGPPLLLDKAALACCSDWLDTPDIRPQQADRLRQRLRNLFPDAPPELLTSAQRAWPWAALLSLGIRRASPWRPSGFSGASTTPLEALARRFWTILATIWGPQQLNEFMLARLARAREFLSLLENMKLQVPRQPAAPGGPLHQPLLLRLDAPLLCQQNRSPNCRRLPSFDLTLLSLGVLINLAEHSDENQRRVSRLPGLIDRLAELFNVRFLRAPALTNFEEHLPDGSGAGGGSGSGGPDGRTEGMETRRMRLAAGGDLEFGGHPSPFDRRVGAGGSRSQPPHAAGRRRISQPRSAEQRRAHGGLGGCRLRRPPAVLPGPAGHPPGALIRTRLKPQPSFVPVLSCTIKSAVSRVEDAIREEDRMAASSEATDAWSAPRRLTTLASHYMF